MTCFLPFVIRVRQGDTTLFWIALVLSVSGISTLFIAKLPLYRQGKYFSFGCKELPVRHRKLYWTAYVLLGLSVFIMLMLLAVLR